ncbi:MAG: PAS domain-containing protein [Candidatus Electryonea clarkiae]|nr:PAS domain-containing protein [Candidatus Electryonea clarkiae]
MSVIFNLLILENEDKICKGLEEALTKGDILLNPSIARDEKELEDLLKTNPPNEIVAEASFSGFQLETAINMRNQITPAVSFIVVAMDEAETTGEMFLNQGVSEYVVFDTFDNLARAVAANMLRSQKFPAKQAKKEIPAPDKEAEKISEAVETKEEVAPTIEIEKEITPPIEAKEEIADSAETTIEFEEIFDNQGDTMRVDAQESLQSETRRFEELLSNHVDGILILNKENNIVFSNPSAEAVFRSGAGNMAGKPLHDFLDADNCSIICQYLASWQQGEHKSFQLEIALDDNTSLPFKFSISPRVSEIGDIIETLVTFHPVEIPVASATELNAVTDSQMPSTMNMPQEIMKAINKSLKMAVINFSSTRKETNIILESETEDPDDLVESLEDAAQAMRKSQRAIKKVVRLMAELEKLNDNAAG